MKRKLIICALTALLLTCVCTLCGCSGNTVIDLEDYVSVDFSGYDGAGTANVHIDAEAILPLIDDRNSPIAIAGSFTAGKIENNGKLSNGDTISVAVKYSEKMLENAKINVQNPTLSFTVSGLKEKDKLDVFAAVEFISEGTSLECVVSIKYNGGYPFDMFELETEDGEIITNRFGDRKYTDGEKVTIRLTESALEELGAQYLIEETSREYTVKADGRYILTAVDLTDENRKTLDKTAEDFVNEKIQAITSNNDKSTRIRLLSNVSGVNAGRIAAGIPWRIDKLDVKELNSAYVGIGNVSGNWGGTIPDKKTIYYFFDADFSYYIEDYKTVYEEDTVCALIVRIDDPKITTDGLVYSNITFDSAKDCQTAYNSYITSDFEKLP